MSALGFDDWVAQDESGYARIAVEQAANLERLAQFRREARARIAASPAGNPEFYTRAVEQAYVRMWERMLESRAAG